MELQRLHVVNGLKIKIYTGTCVVISNGDIIGDLIDRYYSN